AGGGQRVRDARGPGVQVGVAEVALPHAQRIAVLRLQPALPVGRAAVVQARHDQHARVHSVASETSVDLTSAITSLPGARPSSRTERVVMTDVTSRPCGVSTSTSETTGPSTISRTLPRNWLRTLMAVMLMGASSKACCEASKVAAHPRIGNEGLRGC